MQWEWRLNGIIGARGTGKTILLLQRLSDILKHTKAVYLSLDEFYFTENRLYPTIVELRSRGYTHFFLDEIHKYTGWSRELKNLYDTYEDIHIIFTGSSILDILKQEVDLSRRAVMYEMPELSFREYLSLDKQLDIPSVPLADILSNHVELASNLPADFRPVAHFQRYLKTGAYPFFLEGEALYHHRLLQVVHLIIESDLQFIEGYDPRNARKIFQLLYILAQNVPFKPNISKLSEKIGVTRNTLIQYLHYLEKANILHLLYNEGQSISILQKPEKVLLHNPNLAHTISPTVVNVGSIRESFFVSQVRLHHRVALHAKADFVIDEQYVFEIGGTGKTQKQLRETPQGYLVKDDIELGYENVIPLWMFGLLY